MNNLDELAALQAALKAQGREVAVDYILAVPASRYGDFADSLGTMATQQPSDTEWASHFAE